MTRVCHIITTVSTGGAEMMLYKLLSNMDKGRYESQVISLTGMGPAGERIQSLGIPVRTMDLNGSVPNPIRILRLMRWLRRDKPQVIQTWMYDADLIGGFVAKFAGRIPVAWGVRHANLDPSVNKARTIRLAKISARLSNWLPSKIVCCSQASVRVHEQIGYARDRMLVIPNGFDLDEFSPSNGSRDRAREELGVPLGVPVIGLVGRWHPQKDHANFFGAARLIVRGRQHPDVHFVLSGSEITWENAELVRLIAEAGVHHQTHLLGWRNDVPRINAAVDVASSSSCGEGFPNVVGEAMACGVPCVVTDVGDSAVIVGDNGRVVPARDPEALAAAWAETLEMPDTLRAEMGMRGRASVEERYDIQHIAERYGSLYEEMVASRRS